MCVCVYEYVCVCVCVYVCVWFAASGAMYVNETYMVKSETLKHDTPSH